MSQSTALQHPGFDPDAISVYDDENPRSVLGLLTPGMKEAAIRVPSNYRNLDERTAKSKFRPSPAMNQIRAAFWLEYNMVQTIQKPHIDPHKVYAGIVSRDYFFNVVLKSKEMMAWMLIPPQQYQAILNEAWTAAMDRMREILDAPLYDKKGHLSTQTANLIIKVFSLLDQRKHGSVVQKQVNVNLTGEQAKEAALAMTNNSMEALDKRLADLDKKMKKAGAPVTDPTEVEAVKVPVES